jgi:hypothetical protein
MNHSRQLLKQAAGAVCGLALVGAAAAAPAGAARGILLDRIGGVPLAPRAMPPMPPAPVEVPRLDLRPPATLTGFAGLAESNAEATFPSMRRVDAALSSSSDAVVAAMRSAVQIRSRSGIEGIANRIHREGIPIARLWESRSALLSLGLSPRGKPGIWLIQKIP